MSALPTSELPALQPVARLPGAGLPSATLPHARLRDAGLLLDASGGGGARRRAARHDISDGAAQWRLACSLGWLDIKLRYRGSALGPFWLTLSSAVMIASMGLLYGMLFGVVLSQYLPFLAISMILWQTGIGGDQDARQ